VRFSKPSPALVISLIALVFAMTGTGIAAKGLVTGKQIRDGSISAQDLSASVRKQLARTGAAGAAGPAGAPGAKGDQGPKGDQGAKGDTGVPPAPEALNTITTFNNTWQAWGAGYTVHYWKDLSGVVHLMGGIKGGTVSSGTTSVPIFTLPDGYRPTQIQYLPIVSTDSSNVPKGGAYVEVCAPPTCATGNDGEVSVYGADNFYVSLDGISFRAR
jgi:hypothetical protein